MLWKGPASLMRHLSDCLSSAGLTHTDLDHEQWSSSPDKSDGELHCECRCVSERSINTYSTHLRPAARWLKPFTESVRTRKQHVFWGGLAVRVQKEVFAGVSLTPSFLFGCTADVIRSLLHWDSEGVTASLQIVWGFTCLGLKQVGGEMTEKKCLTRIFFKEVVTVCSSLSPPCSDLWMELEEGAAASDKLQPLTLELKSLYNLTQTFFIYFLKSSYSS